MSAACWLDTDTCASKYLKSSPNAFWNYITPWWGEHKINHRPRWLPRGWLQHSLFCGNKNTAISGICGWWQLTNTAASCPVSLNFNFMLLQSMSATVCLFLHHSLNPLLTICPLALDAFLSTILICLGSHFSTRTVLHRKKRGATERRQSTKEPLQRHHGRTWVRIRKCHKQVNPYRD